MGNKVVRFGKQDNLFKRRYALETYIHRIHILCVNLKDIFMPFLHSYTKKNIFTAAVYQHKEDSLRHKESVHDTMKLIVSVSCLRKRFLKFKHSFLRCTLAHTNSRTEM